MILKTSGYRFLSSVVMLSNAGNIIVKYCSGGSSRGSGGLLELPSPSHILNIL